MIAASRNPLNRTLLLDLGEQARIYRLAAGKISLLAMHRVMVNQLHVFLQTVVHECDSIGSARVISWQEIALLFVPLDLVTSDAIHAARSHAVGPARAEEPKAKVNNVVMESILHWQLVSELVMHAQTVKIVVIWHRCGVFLLLLQLEHLIGVDICLKVMVAWHEAPWHLKIGQSLSEWLVVFLPKFCLLAIPGLPTDHVTCDRDKVGLLLRHERPNHCQCLMIQVALARLPKVQVGQLHHFEAIVSVHFQVQPVQPVKIVISHRSLGAQCSHN